MEPLASTRTLLFAILVLAGALAFVGTIAAATGEPTDSGNGSPLGDGIYETAGDWVVEAGQTLSYSNLTIVANGNITVGFGGSVTLRGVTLVMNNTGGVPFHIIIEPTAVLVMMDKDGNATTTADGSVAKAKWPSHRYSVEVQRGGTMQVLRSSLTDLGSAAGVGLHVLSDDVRLEDARVEAFDSVLVESAAPSFVRVVFAGTVDSSLFFSSSAAVLDHCTVNDCYTGVSIHGSPAPALLNLTIINSFYPLDLDSTTVVMRGGLLRQALYGSSIRLNTSARATLVDVTFDEDKVEILDATSALEVHWTLELHVVDQDYRPVERASVEVNDSRGQVVYDGTTDTQGNANVEILDHTRTRGAVDSRNPHAIIVRKDRYHAQDLLSITSTTFREIRLTTNLNPIVEVSSPRPGTRVVMGMQITLNATGTYDPNGDVLEFKWTTNLGDRVLYDGPAKVANATLLLGESTITLTVTDGLGGLNATTVPVTVLQATQVTIPLNKPQYTATLVATYGGSGTVVLDEATYPPPYPGDLIGVFVTIHASGDVILAGGTLEVRYDTSLIPFGMNESSLAIAREDAGIWTTLPGSTVDTEGHAVSAAISSFGVYAVRGVMPPNIPPRLFVFEAGRLVPPHDVSFPVGTHVELGLTAEDELPAFAMLDVTGLPPGLHVDRSTKTIWGVVPDQAGSWHLGLTLTDVGGLTAMASIWLNTTGSMPLPQLWSGTVSPTKGDSSTIFEARVLYMSGLDLPPAFVRLEAGKDRFDMVPENPDDVGYTGGVMYHTYFMLNSSSRSYKLHFNASDGTRVNRTETPIGLSVTNPSYVPTGIELAIIVVTLLAIIVIIAIIRMTSARYITLRDAHLGSDSEEGMTYIKPEPKPRAPEEAPPAGEEGAGERVGKGEDEGAVDDAGKGPPGGAEAKLADKAGTGSGKAPPVIERPEGEKEPSPKAEDEDLGKIDSEVEHLDKQLGEIDSEIDNEEADLSKIDDDIEGIIDELDSDRKKD